MSVWTLTHALITQQIHSKVTFEALFASLIAFETASVTLRTYSIDLIVIAWTVIPTCAIEK